MLINPMWTLVAVALPLLWVAMESGDAGWFPADDATDEELERDGLYDEDLWRGP